jgi:hypothetical protein
MEDAFRAVAEHASEFFKELGGDIADSGIGYLVKTYPAQSMGVLIFIVILLLVFRSKR